MIDTRTMLFAVAVGSTLFGLILAAYRNPAGDDRILRGWIWAQLLKGLGAFLLFMRGSIPLWLSLGGNTVAFAGFAVEMLCYAAYAGYGHLWRPLLVAPLLATVAYNLVQVGMVHGLPAPMAPLVSSFAYFSMAGSSGALLLFSRTRRRSRALILLGGGNMAFALVALARASASLGAADVGIFSNWVPHTVILVMIYVLVIVNGFSFLLAVKEDGDRSLERMAATDDLTGVANRRAFMAATETMRRLGERTGQPVSLIMLDLDHFKSVNDTFGHGAGDSVLRLASAAVLDCLREVDILGRLGGEEFAITLPATPLANAVQAAERVRLAMERVVVPHPAGDIHVTVSLGVTVLRAGEPLDAALARADAGLYSAKETGRNKVVAVAPQDGEGAR